MGLAAEGKKVLLIDADPQGSLTISLGYHEPDALEQTITNALINEINDEDYDVEPCIIRHKANQIFKVYIELRLMVQWNEKSIEKSTKDCNRDKKSGIYYS